MKMIDPDLYDILTGDLMMDPEFENEDNYDTDVNDLIDGGDITGYDDEDEFPEGLELGDIADLDF